jgi:steroid delta-isomerase-like uncharacterized protein
MLPVEKNKLIARRLFEEFWNNHNPNIPTEFYTDDFTLTDPYVPMKGKGFDLSKNYFDFFMRAFPDLKFTIEEQVAEGDLVVTRLFATGTHEGELFGMPATHTKTTLPVIVFHRFENGKISNAFVYWDVFGFFRATGAFTPTGVKMPAFAMR